MSSSLTGTDIGLDPGRDPVNGRFTSKHADIRRARVMRVAERLKQLRATYTIAGPADDATLSLVAALYIDAEIARSRVSKVRCVNAATRLLRTLKRKPEPPPPSLQELLAPDDEAGNG